jgi:hypothetical protein
MLMAVCLALLAPIVAHAQQSQPAYQTMPGSQPDEPNATDVNGQPLSPDTRSLAGVQTVSLGVPALERSYWQPSVNVTAAGDSDPLFQPSTTSWSEWTTLLAGLILREDRGRSQFALDYVGGGEVSNDPALGNAVVQEMQVGERIVAGRRISVELLDQADYIPETSFGYGELSNLTLPENGTLGLQPSLVPNETILSPRGQRLINSSLAEVDIMLSPRAIFTLAGGYALLHYYNQDTLNFNNVIGQAGVSVAMSPHDAVALVYRYDSYRFPNQDVTLLGHVGEVFYGRRVTGKLAFQVGAGAEWAIYRLPSVLPSATTWPNRVYWIADASLSYELERTILKVDYSHGISGGSGVETGTIADTVTGGISSQMTRTFHGDLSIGYARNEQPGLLQQLTGTTYPTFDYTFGTAGLEHPLGRNMTWSLGYLVQYQRMSQTYCVLSACGTSILRQQASLGFNFHTRPHAIE